MSSLISFLLNTWEDLEATTVKALREEECYEFIPVYPVGPLFRPFQSYSSRSGLLDWLDQQPVESVLYIAFGSSGPGVLSAQQITEMAWGLELSQQRFIWVLRSPNKIDELPDGFLARTHNLGLVVTQWALQSEILGHPSTGAWPLYAEQKMNAAMLTEELGVAMRPKIAPTKGIVAREEIEMMVRKVIMRTIWKGKQSGLKLRNLKTMGKGLD
uniref:Uncharacterized protein n=1 Tax=Fagus sylvatica TaxID=28930 RepID=A0A2N9HG59_FAGSY